MRWSILSLLIRAIDGLRTLAAGSALLLLATAQAQLTVAPETNVQQLAAAITGPGVSISNPVITCHALGYGEYAYSGSAIDITEGVILTSGRIIDALGPNNNVGNTNSFQQGTPGDPLLNAVTGRSTRDACKLEFDIIPSGDSLNFEFTFGSEEYNEWVGSQYNDVFGFFISGPGIAGDPGAGSDHNIALITGTSTPVTINNVNNGSNSAYYHDNAGGVQTQYDGYTLDLIARAVVQPCQSYHLKLIIADATDRKYDSGVFIEKIESPTVTMTPITLSGGPNMVEGCNPGWIRFERSGPTIDPLPLQYYLSGTATNGTDYTAIGNVDPAVAKTITIPVGQSFVDRSITPLVDGLNENIEFVRCVLGNPECNGLPLDTVLFNIADSLVATCTPGGTICAGGSMPLNVTGGQGWNWTPAAGLSCTSCANPQASPATDTWYHVTVTEGLCSRGIDRLVRVSNLALSTAITAPLCSGSANGAINLEHSGGIAPYSYSWTGPGGFTAGTQDITNIPAGTYTVTVTDAACSRTQSWNVIAPAALSVSLSAPTLPFGQHIACFGGTTGSINAVINGGTGPYTSAWTGPGGFTSTSSAISALAAGSYAISVTDMNGCTAGAGTTLTQSPAISFSATATGHVLCFGANTGSASSFVSGGIPPYAYAWSTSPVQTASAATGLGSGSYSVTLTDTYNCTATANVTINGPAQPLGTTLIAQTNVLCHGSSTGSAGISISGGTSPYSTSWNTTPPQSGTAATGLPAGIWTATVVDANGCSTTRVVTITQPSGPLSASLFSQTNVLCSGDQTGSATVSASGGTGPYTYEWNTAPPQYAATANGLAAGNHICTVRDLNNCTTTVNVSITQPATAVSASISAASDVLCPGGSTGSATVNANGGVGSYAYSWNTSPVQTSATAINLPAGIWTCTLTDANGCAASATANIGQASLLSSTITGQMNVLCFGDNTGSATINSTGGTGTHAYSWNTLPPQTSAMATGLAAGSHICTVTDANGCSTSSTVTITQPDAPLGAALGAQTDVGCFGNSDGSVAAIASGGSPVYAYSWNTIPVQNTPTATALPVGTWTCAITDANGCGTSLNATITGPASALSASITGQTDVLIFGQSTGSATATASGGTMAYTYAWSDGQTAATANGLAAGTYAVTVTDANGCTVALNVSITQPGSALSGSLIAQGPVDCHGNATGTATVSASGGVEPYSYSWNTTPVQTGASASGLSAGPWTCTISDVNGASTTVGVNIAQPANPLGTSILAQTNVACSGDSTGSALVGATGGTAPYAMIWNTAPPVPGTEATGLAAGIHVCTVTDANGCSAAQNVIITEPASALSASIVDQTPVDCFGNSTGSAITAAQGGTAGYSYSWNTAPVQTSATATDLPAGIWTCTIIDVNGCSTTANAVITQPSMLSAGITDLSQATCGLNNGGATANASGGTAPYAYSWNSVPVQNGALLSDVGAGTYTCTITDDNGCGASAIAAISAPAGLTISLVNSSDQTCFGSANGQATVAASGGNGPYSYTWNTSPTQTGPTASGLLASLYTATATDADGCTAQVPIVIDGPAAALGLAITNVTDVLCYNDTSGSATVLASGGTAPYAYSWNTNPTSVGATLNNATAGTWTALVVDANGCTSSINVDIEQPILGIQAIVEDQHNVTCHGGNDGWVHMDVSGGSGSYTISWNTVPPQSGTTASGLAAGMYTMSVIDNNGCDTQKDFVVVITQPAAALSIAYTTSSFNGHGLSCIGSGDGWIDVTASGGTAPYSYSWTNSLGQVTGAEDLSGLDADAYALTMSDAYGCSTSITITLTEPPAIQATGIVTPAACQGTNDGAVSIAVSGGAAPYTYLWSGPNGFASNSEDISGIVAGVYTVNITDAQGCSMATPFDVNQPGQFSISAVIGTFIGGGNTSCANSSDGSIDVSVSGGTLPYAFTWSGPNGAVFNTEDITGLTAGNYDLSITDANGCGVLASYALSSPPMLVATAQTLQYGAAQISCHGASDGAIDATITGGTSAYDLLWNGPNAFASTSEDLSALAAGTYTLLVTDANGCSASVSSTLTEPAPLTAALTTSLFNSGDAISCDGASDGAIELGVAGGEAPYGVGWTGPNGFTSANADIGGLGAGTYDVLITDANGCTTTASASLSAPAPLSITGVLSLYTGGTNVSCPDGDDGSIDLQVIGGAGGNLFQWTGSNAFASNDEDPADLAAGDYHLLLTDQNGCTASTDLILTAPAPISATATTLTATCQGTATGGIDINTLGGTAPYSFFWSGPAAFSSTDEDLTALFAGVYIATITDANNCTHVQPFDVDEPGLITVTTSASIYPGGMNTSCAGTADGAIYALASGGTPGYYYAWGGPNGFSAITPGINGLVEGLYHVTVTDQNGCATLAQQSIISAAPINTGLSAGLFNGGVNTSCSGTADGSINAAIAGGLTPYTLQWSGPNGFIAISEDLTGLEAGDYTLEVIDAVGCTVNDSITLVPPAPIDAQVTAQAFPNGGNVSCPGASDGAIDLAINGGTAPYFISWSGPEGFGSTSQDLSGLYAGDYTANITDGNGCTSSVSIGLIAPPALQIALSTSQYGGGYEVDCFGNLSGAITANVNGGMLPLSYAWTGPGGFTSTVSGLSDIGAGAYVLTVTDSVGCMTAAGVSLNAPPPVQVNSILSDAGFGHEVGCSGSDGAISISASGGSAPYTFDWTGSNGFASTDEDLTALSAGNYALTITDANGCISSTSYDLDQAAALQAATSTTANLCAGLNDGSIALTPTGGVLPYGYSWTGPNNFTSSSEDLQNISAGNYTVIITDAAGCTAQADATIAAGSPMTMTAAISDYGSFSIPCSGDSTGVIEVHVDGGQSPLILSWSGPNGFSSSASDLATLIAGDYTVTVTDGNGCSMDSTFTLTEPAIPLSGSLSAAVQPGGTNVSCPGGGDGSIDLTILGGLGPYIVSWHGGDDSSFDTEDITGLVAGVYDVVITDAHQCTHSTSITLTEPDSALAINMSIGQYAGGFNTSCAGTTDGWIAASITGGSGGYAISWTGPNGFTASTDSIGSLSEGTYAITASDLNGCTLTQEMIVVAPQPITWELLAAGFPGGTNVSCHGMNDGAISTSVNGGSGTYEAAWTGPNGFVAADPDLTGLFAGTYCLNITDGNGCTASDCITLSEPSALVASASSSPAACGQSNGSIDVSVSGGAAPYTYAWAHGPTSEDLTDLVAGIYSLGITDENGCVEVLDITVGGSAGLLVSAATTDVPCAGEGNGSIDLSVLNGTAPFTFAWSNGASSEDLSALIAGGYQVSVSDANGCSWSEVILVQEPPALTATGAISDHGNGNNVSAQGASDGSIDLAVSGGTPPYGFDWSNGATTSALQGLPAGHYTVTITDANGCMLVLAFTLVEPSELQMPTGYTPNGDGSNDAFVILGLEKYHTNQLVVFNRWGNKVFDQLNYRNDWRGENQEGQPLPNGTYFVILRLNDGGLVLQNYVDLRR